MPEHLVIWSLKVEADTVEQAALKAIQVMPTINAASGATKMVVLDDQGEMDTFLQLEGTGIDIQKFLEWLKTQPTFKEKPNES